ncbi:MAG TPA: 50S ribosomal protein L25 [Actinomycetota bacterium]|nr:50S ribosomal protein L25 [Actinomycetota bacterium]
MAAKLKAERRDGAGKGVARKLRAAGRVPAVVYGHGTDPLPVSIDARELFHVLHTDAGMNVMIDVKVDGETFLAMPREVQRDFLRDRFIHLDLIRIARDEKITVEVPIHLVGESHGVKEGGVVEHHLWNLQIECLPQDVPNAIQADITPLGINESLKVTDVKIPGNVTVLTAEDEVVVSVVPPQVLKVEEEEAVEGEEVLEGEEGAEGEAAEGEETPPAEGAEEASE